MTKRLRIAFVHPNLGIGGAERLVVDAAVALQERGHTVEIFTAHHKPPHAFQETFDGTLSVTELGSWIPSQLFGRMFALMAVLRMWWVSWWVVLGWSGQPFDAVVVDQVSACVPILRWSGAKIVFYCHFPDQLLTDRKTRAKRLYRAVMDALEEKTTGMSDVVLVNSRFTASVFKETFPSLRHITPRVLYPAVDVSAFVPKHSSPRPRTSGPISFVSINRFERKKHVDLALRAAALALQQLSQDLRERFRVVIAGGYDPLVEENVQYLEELKQLADDLELPPSCVEFKPDIPFSALVPLLQSARAVLYTPSNEHLGIVPLEAMAAKAPVIAVQSGGPKETVLHNRTGLLCDPTPESFASAMAFFASHPDEAAKMGEAGSEHVRKTFDRKGMGKQFEEVMLEHVSA